MKTTSEKQASETTEQHQTSVIRANTPGEWTVALVLLVAIFQFFWTYHVWRGKPYSLTSASECLGFAALAGICISLSLGPIARIWNIPWAVFRLRRPVGVLGALFTLPHGIISLFFLPASYPWSFYVKNWDCLLLGAIGVLGFLYLAWISRDSVITRLGLDAWKRRLRWAWALLVISVVHFMVLSDKIPGWVSWAHKLDKVPPGSILAVGIALIALFWRAADAIRRTPR